MKNSDNDGGLPVILTKVTESLRRDFRSPGGRFSLLHCNCTVLLALKWKRGMVRELGCAGLVGSRVAAMR